MSKKNWQPVFAGCFGPDVSVLPYAHVYTPVQSLRERKASPRYTAYERCFCFLIRS